MTRKIWRVTVPFVDDMGSISPFVATESTMESKEANALWTINSMRSHDCLQPLRRLPRGTRFYPQPDEDLSR